MRRTLASTVLGLLVSMAMSACANASTSDAPNASPANAATKEAAEQPLKLTVPSGTNMTVELEDGISTAQSSPGDPFTGTLSKDVIVDGLTAFQKGSIVHGRVLEVQEPGQGKGRAQLKLELTSVEHNGKDVPIQTQSYVGIAHHTRKRDADVNGDAAGIGTAIGEIAGDGKEAEFRTGVTTKDHQVHYPPETRLLFTLASPVEI